METRSKTQQRLKETDQDKIAEEIKNKLTYIRTQWLIEIFILSPIFIAYIYVFKENFILMILSLVLYIVVIINWCLRPRDL